MNPGAGQGSRLEAGLLALLLLGVVAAVIPFGSNREWSWSVCALFMGVVGVAWSALALLRVVRAWQPPLVASVLFLLVCAWAWLQTWAGLPSDWAHPLWSLAVSALGTGSEFPMTVSLAADDGMTALMRYAAYGLVFFLAFQLGQDPNRAAGVVRWLAIAGVVMAGYGLAACFGQWDRLLGIWPFEARTVVRGTFVNRNSFATWMGLMLLCALALSWRHVAPRRNPAYQLPSSDLAQRLERFLVSAWRPLLMLLLMSAALFLSGSRGGFAATLAATLVFLSALGWRRWRGSTGRRVLVAMVVAALVCTFWLTGSGLMKRLDRSGADMASRVEAYTLVAGGIDDNPALGFGYGTFADSFRLYRDERLRAHFDKAHNTYMENLFELGWPVALAQFAVIAALLLTCLRGWRRRSVNPVYPALGIAATVLVAVHSLVDFSLQIPATAMAYALIMGIACAQSRRGSIYS